jgi:MoxR-like ATPase
MSTITAPSVAAIADKLSQIPEFIEAKVGVKGRRAETNLLLVCIGGKLHPLFYGPPGVAKSMTVDNLRRHFPSLSQFKTQAYKASPPEQFLGQISIKGMADDKFYRLIERKLPDVEIGVIDEVARAPRALLPSFQGMMVEREFDSGAGVQPVPLQSLIGTANHVPDDPELEAFFDRFTFKIVVKGPQSQQEFVSIMETIAYQHEHGIPGVPDELTVSADELREFQAFVRTVRVDRSIYLKLGELWANILALDIYVSPRRWGDLLLGMKVQAALDGREELIEDDLQLAQHSLWNRPEDAPRVYGEVVKFASEWVKAKAQIIASFQDTLDRLNEVQSAIAAGADPFGEVTLGDPDDPASKKKLMDHGIKLVTEQKTVAELAGKHIAEATGQDTSDLDSVLVQIDAAKQWVQDRLLGGLSL